MSDPYEEWAAPEDQHEDTGAVAAPVLELAFQNVYEFVDLWLLPRYRRKPDTKWDPRWFENLEALDRLEALWRSFEYMRHQGMTGMQVFWNDYLGPTMRELTSAEGVFWYVTDYTAPGEARTEPPLLRSDQPPAEVLI
ncbi:DUF4913 domain-containing protein [Curtobacterium sp. MCBD17_026]|uniref:DUF4913 domain-containing protein n=1 Tax=Curtobacterium sp. MCBD17_026 TaxID=2175621 RepID=UPI000DAAB034|nr:DUF4913 domain-containing protein [Curtobacterium sp. MCBD17_026]WIB72605.1 DUF4913 domain-containing protein [Curtobacterium sp. MCBD17_026]